jgi:hypothetical protein
MDHVEHQVQVDVGPENIDLVIELRFNEVPSLGERRRMDLDRNGLISDAEQQGYLRRAASRCADAFRLTWRDRPLDLIPLYDPQLDLLGVTGVSPNHHVLRLYYFARTPAGLSPGDRLVVDDRAWPGPPALRLFSAGGKDGLRLQSVQGSSTQPGPDATGSTTAGEITIVEAPRPASAATAPSSANDAPAAAAEFAAGEAASPTPTLRQAATPTPPAPGRKRSSTIPVILLIVFLLVVRRRSRTNTR